MYWQVYMHKTVLSSESLLVNVLKRAKELAMTGEDLFATPALRFFMYNNIGPAELGNNGIFTPDHITFNFTRLDDSDVLASIKYWADDRDKVLRDLSRRLMTRDLLAIELQNEPFPGSRVDQLRDITADRLKISRELTDYYVFTEAISNLTYAPNEAEVMILLKNGTMAGISAVSDIFDHKLFLERITRHFLCYPKECR
jgi:HD superfamily phosphohydrolase